MKFMFRPLLARLVCHDVKKRRKWVGRLIWNRIGDIPALVDNDYRG